MEAPTIGGVRVRKGNGETVRLARGASLTDFAEKVGVDPASLGVQDSTGQNASYDLGNNNLANNSDDWFFDVVGNIEVLVITADTASPGSNCDSSRMPNAPCNRIFFAFGNVPRIIAVPPTCDQNP